MSVAQERRLSAADRRDVKRTEERRQEWAAQDVERLIAETDSILLELEQWLVGGE